MHAYLTQSRLGVKICYYRIMDNLSCDTYFGLETSSPLTIVSLAIVPFKR